jgi:wobble nucleotide-excising tRNase
MLKGEVERYHKSVAVLDKQIGDLTEKITEGRKTARTLSAEISDLNGRIVSTEASKNDINSRLRDSGFQGFRLDDNPSAKGTYRVIRENGDVAENLSEGERNFIAFLYFYHTVRGGQNPSELGKPKIVVVDDPVSSMDSSVLFIVSTLVREMIEVCHNNDKYEGRKVQGEYIKQLFVLTHNAYFHKVITYNKSAHQDYPCVSFFMVKKASNVSTVTLCQKKATDFEKDTTMVNVNPVQNSYAALWGEYREVDTVIPLQAVIRRILEYYFLQICGHDGDELHEEVLVKNREKFIMVQPNGSEDRTKYDIASAMLTYLGSRAAGIGDGLHYVDGCDDIKMHREVFKLIFDSLGQSQHYKMMLDAQAGDSTTTEEEASA